MEVTELMNSTVELNQLESTVDRLMRTIEQLAADNKALRRQVHSVIRERDAVLAQKQRTVTQIKHLFHKVKESSL